MTHLIAIIGADWIGSGIILSITLGGIYAAITGRSY